MEPALKKQKIITNTSLGIESSSSPSSYQGYRFPKQPAGTGCTTTNHHKTNQQVKEAWTMIPRVDWTTTTATTPEDFFQNYIRMRRPCILQNHDSFSPYYKNQHQFLQALEEIAQDTTVQVEQRTNDTERFGQSRWNSIKTTKYESTMKLSDFMQNKNPLQYLSTQEPPPIIENPVAVARKQKDPSSSNSSNRCTTTTTAIPPPFFGPPCHRLSGLPKTLPCAGNLRLAFCNLWMGYHDKTIHSGLHHDFHDNFYCLLSGRKEFRLYAPSDAPYMGLSGNTAWSLHFNGLISYKNNPSRADGVPVSQIATLDTSEDEDSETPFIVGKGFDYQSSSEEDNNCNPSIDNNQDDFDDDDDDVQNAQDDAVTVDEEQGSSDTALPSHFSMIDPTQPMDTILAKFPLFQYATECVVDLSPGEMLYLPASWFHCVTSTKDQDDLHLAVNYWYYPPDKLDDFQRPYQDTAFFSE